MRKGDKRTRKIWGLRRGIDEQEGVTEEPKEGENKLECKQTVKARHEDGQPRAMCSS